MHGKLILVLGVPLVGGALVLGAMALRPGTDQIVLRPKKVLTAAVPISENVVILPAPPPPPAPRPAPEKEVALAMDEARLRTTYQNYRTALATGNQAQAEALYPVLQRDRKAAVKLAEQDLAQARQDFDRAMAGKALDALRR